MEEKGFDLPKLSEATGIKLNFLQNILYGRSSKVAHLNKIARAFGIPVTDLIHSKNETTIDIVTYLLATSVVIDTLKTSGLLQFSSSKLHEYIDEVYKMALEEKDSKYLSVFVKGMISSHTKLGLIKTQNPTAAMAAKETICIIIKIRHSA